MSENKKKRLITAALPYINNLPHLGHIVGCHLPADIFARFSRSKGYETIFVGGTDENGSASEIAAKKLGIDLVAFSDKLYEEHKNVYEWFNLSYDNFSRTSKKIHEQTVKTFFQKLHEKGYIKEGTLPVFYSPTDEMFLPDRYVVGECPKCGYDQASGDQCEKCTSVLDPQELINPRSAVSGDGVEIRETNHLFLALDKLEPEIKAWITSQDHWRKQVRNLALGWLKEGLRERCITRDLKNGITVPLEGYTDKVFYVWFDAPIGYVSSSREILDDYESWWSGDADTYYFIGKDNIPFHTIFWPGMIIGQAEYSLAKNVVGLQYLNYEGQKFSKSKQIGVFCEKLPSLELPADVWRAYLTQVIPETGDSEFKWNDFQEHINSSLIGNYGNFVNRVVKFGVDRLGGTVTRPESLSQRDKDVLKELEAYKKRIEEYYEAAELRKAYAEALAASSLGNKYIHDMEPWVTRKTDAQRTNATLYVGARILKAVTTFIAPCIPQTAERVWKQLGLTGSPLDAGAWDAALDDLSEEHGFGEPDLLFQKLDDDAAASYKEIASTTTPIEELF